ncbi:hypothetical protein Tco_0822470 [Tanacetum coccineum]|uniref:Tf2-1-like SH3-like domain-containing protein n=1 Tax=Tanacetum coccineum TaxID=301880 RepID=A0ABQ5AG91_9ASTR
MQALVIAKRDTRMEALSLRISSMVIEIMLKVSPIGKVSLRFWKNWGKFEARGYIEPFKVLAQSGEPIAYRLELPQQLSRVHSIFHVSNLKKCLSDEPLAVPVR